MTSLFQIRRRAINLPNLDQRVADWLTSGIENPPTQMGDLPHRRSDRIAHNDQIVVSIAREFVWIEWASSHLRRPAHQFFGKEARHGKIARCQRGRLQETTTRKVTAHALHDSINARFARCIVVRLINRLEQFLWRDGAMICSISGLSYEQAAALSPPGNILGIGNSSFVHPCPNDPSFQRNSRPAARLGAVGDLG